MYDTEGHLLDSKLQAISSQAKAAWVQGGLDVIGMTDIPIISQIAELFNAGISLSQGDYVGASLNIVSMVPVMGKAAEAAKFARKADKIVDIARATQNTAEAAGRVSKVTKEITSNPFKGKTFSQIDEMFKAKGFTTKDVNPLTGKGSYFSPKGTRFYLDKGGMYKKGFEGPHVDIWYNGHPSFEKIRYFLDGSSKTYELLK